jgi:ABC-type lipoprotein export system ATPase subunit
MPSIRTTPSPGPPPEVTNETLLTIARSRFGPPAPTRRSCEVAAALGFATDRAAPPDPTPDPLELPLRAGELTLVVGPSGSGKSTLLRDLARAARDRGWRVARPGAGPLPARPCVDLVGRGVDDALAGLALAGLADARTLLRRPAELSDGQRWRLRLARAIERARTGARGTGGALLVIDELAATLDPPAAASVAQLLRRVVDREPALAAVAATPRDEVVAAASADRVLELTLLGSARVRTPRARRRGAALARFRMRDAGRAELEALAPFHYLASRPATVERVIAAWDRASGELAGALATSRPTLNGAWRERAWPGRFAGRSAATRINRDLRCVSRVIVDPRFRGLGLASGLVRRYLCAPDTVCTEAVAAMGRVCPFFRSAGMTAYPLTPPARSARLLDALAHAGVEPWRLAQPAAALARARRATSGAFVERELRAWARASRATTRHARRPIGDLMELAAASIAAAPVAYAHTARDTEDHR